MSETCHEIIAPYSASQMCAVVKDVESYNQFIPWCNESVIEEDRGEHGVVATLHIQSKGVKVSFTTLNRVVPDAEVIMELVSGPFEHLKGEWLFTPLGADGCKIRFCLSYRFSNRIYAKLLSPVFDKVSDSIITAFLHRAEQIYD